MSNKIYNLTIDSFSLMYFISKFFCSKVDSFYCPSFILFC